MSIGSVFFSRIGTELGHGYFFVDLERTEDLSVNTSVIAKIIPAEVRMHFGTMADDVTLYCSVSWPKANTLTEYGLDVFTDEKHSNPLLSAQLSCAGKNIDPERSEMFTFGDYIYKEFAFEIVRVLHIFIYSNILRNHRKSAPVVLERLDDKMTERIRSEAGIDLQKFACHLYAIL